MVAGFLSLFYICSFVGFLLFYEKIGLGLLLFNFEGGFQMGSYDVIVPAYGKDAYRDPAMLSHIKDDFTTLGLKAAFVENEGVAVASLPGVYTLNTWGSAKADQKARRQVQGVHGLVCIPRA
jgi:hypothetical protein